MTLAQIQQSGKADSFPEHYDGALAISDINSTTLIFSNHDARADLCKDSSNDSSTGENMVSTVSKDTISLHEDVRKDTQPLVENDPGNGG